MGSKRKAAEDHEDSRPSKRKSNAQEHENGAQADGKAKGKKKREEPEEEEEEEGGEEEEEEEGEKRGSKGQPGRIGAPHNQQLRRVTRERYRKLEADLDENKELYTDPASNDLHKKLDEGNVLYKSVSTPLEAARDSHFLLELANSASIQATKLKSSFLTFDSVRLVKMFAKVMSQDDASDDSTEAQLDWDKLGSLAARFTNRAPSVDFMLGPLKIEHRVIQRQAASRFNMKSEDAKKSQRLTSEEIAKNENETPKNVMDVAKHLEKEGGPVNFLRFVLNPHNFAQSIENIFYVSFLVRDGKATVQVVDGEPMLQMAHPSEEGGAKGRAKKQLIVSLTKDQWKRSCNFYNITTPMIPTRDIRET